MASDPTTTDIVPGVKVTTSGISPLVVIVVAVAVVVIFLLAVGLTLFCCIRRRRRRRNIQPYQSGISNTNPSSTPLIEMQQSGVASGHPSAVKISHPESTPQPTPLPQKYDTSQMQQQIFEAPGNDEHPPDLAFAQQAVHGSLFPGHEGKPEPEPQTPAFLPVSPVPASASPVLSYASPVSPLLTASNPRPSFQPRPSRMNQMSSANGGVSQPQPNPEYHEPPAGIFEAPDTSVPRPVAELS